MEKEVRPITTMHTKTDGLFIKPWHTHSRNQEQENNNSRDLWLSRIVTHYHDLQHIPSGYGKKPIISIAILNTIFLVASDLVYEIWFLN